MGAFEDGVAIAMGVARELGLQVGDQIRLISARRGTHAVLHQPARVGLRGGLHLPGRALGYPPGAVYMPFAEAQSYFNRDGRGQRDRGLSRHPEICRAMVLPVRARRARVDRTWRDSSGPSCRPLQMEDNICSSSSSILVLIATMKIVSALIMLVKNKSRDIVIMRTMGYVGGLCAAGLLPFRSAIGVGGHDRGVRTGLALRASWIDPIYRIS